MAGQQVPKPNGSTDVFRNINKDEDVLDTNFSPIEGFNRAIKVFVASYPELSSDNPVPHFTEYCNEMQALYGVQQPDLSFMQSIYQTVDSEKMEICVSAKRFKGRDGVTNPRLEVHFGKKVTSNNLDPTNEVQPWKPIQTKVSFSTFGTWRRDPKKKMVIKVNGDNWAQIEGEELQPLRSLDFFFAQTSPEGYEEWFKFGRGVELLINVEYRGSKESNIKSEQISRFHLQTIKLMLDSRIRHYRDRTRAKGSQWTDIKHRKIALKSKVTYRRPFVVPQSDEIYWSTPVMGTPYQVLMPFAQRPQKRSLTVKFVDLQIAYDSALDFEDSVCLCNEWCNWNAFFYYNPIYRFLLVRHHQLYLKNRTNISNMYLCASIIAGTVNPPSKEKVPVLHLIYCANEYRKRFYTEFYLKNTDFKDKYHNSLPEPTKMNILSYNRLRHKYDVIRLCHQLDVNPLDETCIENLLDFFQVLSDLHLLYSDDPNYVREDRPWMKDLEIISRSRYRDYFKYSYNLCMNTQSSDYDYLFTEDFEYSSQLLSTEDEIKNKKGKDKILKKTAIDSPFNVRISVNTFLNTIVSVYKFLAKVEPKLAGAYSKEAKKEMVNCYRKMNTDFLFFMTKKINYRMDVSNSGFNDLQTFDIFYTLKLYFYAFELQKHSIASVIGYNRKMKYKEDQVCDIFEFIWKNQVIEHKYRTSYPGEALFEIDPNIEKCFIQFYTTYWGRAHHESTVQRNFEENVSSGHFQYQRLYFWMKNYGNIRLKFKNIEFSVIDSLTDLNNRSYAIFNTILPPIRVLSQNYRNYIQVFDHLVYYLVKAICFVILSTTATLFRKMHALQVKRLCTADMSFSLSKPGWVPLFRTMRSFFGAISGVKQTFIVFDDESNRISNTCLQTTKMIKDIYRQFYAKLVQEWARELDKCYSWQFTNPTIGIEFMAIHLMVGISFAVAFVNDFRLEYRRAYKRCIPLLETTPDQQFPQQVVFSGCLNAVMAYFGDRESLPNAVPFRSNIWKAHLAQIFTQWDQLTEQTLHININAADS